MSLHLKLIVVVVLANGVLFAAPERGMATSLHGSDSTLVGGAAGGPRSPSMALILSATSTVLPIAMGALTLPESGDDSRLGVGMLAAGALLGPALGYSYGECGERGIRGVKTRLGIAFGTGLLAVGLLGTGYAPFYAAVGVGGLGILASDVIDIAHVSSRVRERNQLFEPARITVAPYPLSNPHGLQVALHF